MLDRKVLSRAGACAALVALVMVANPMLRAQDTKPAVEEPQYVGQFVALGPDAKLVPLEQQKPTYQMKTKNHFISVTANGEQTVPGASSSARFAPDVHFIVRVPAGMENTDPNTLMALKPFVVKKDVRSIPMNSAKAGMFQGAKGGQAADTSIALTFKKYGANSLEVIPSQPLPAGEYVLSAANSAQSVYCFGVDTK
jgi:hypothetical protein